MAGIQVFEFDPARLDGTFSDMQPVNDSVQRVESAAPGCCGRTVVTIGSRANERGYRLALPLKSKLPNETPAEPPSNHLSHVMTALLKPPVLQILSGHTGAFVQEVVALVSGPSHCPPGVLNRLRLEGLGGGTHDVAQTEWTWPAPAILDGALLGDLDKDLISLFHPFKMPDLPAQSWSVDLPRCPMSKISARIAAFPNLRWMGQLDVFTKPNADSSTGYDLMVNGDLSCLYDGRRWAVREKEQAKGLCKWIDGLEVLARCAVSIMAQRPGLRHAGLDNPRLVRLEAFRFEPWPRLSIKLDSHLFEQEGNGLLGQSLQMQIQGSPMIGASGEMGLLGPWLEQEDKKNLIRPLVAGLDVVRAEEIAQELGIWLVADGHINLRVGVEARRPRAQTVVAGRCTGAISLAVEARSIRDYDSFVVHQGGSVDTGLRAGIRATIQSPADIPLSDPREHVPKAAFEFTGLLVSRLQKSRPGCRFRQYSTPMVSASSIESRAPLGCLIAPARSWPGDATVDAPVEVPWCS